MSSPQTHKINIEFANETTTTLNLDLDDGKLKQHHRYGSYSKSILVSKPHGFHENDDSKGSSDANLSGSIDSSFRGNNRCCPIFRICSFISYHIPILHPFGPFRCFWDLIVMLMLIYTCIEVPVTLAFNVHLDLTHPSGITALTIDILLLIDILITFRTAYFDKFDRLRLIIDECEIAKRYLVGWFFIDLFTSVPFEFMLPDANLIKFVKVFRVFRFVRIIKILRLFKMIKYFDGFMAQFVTRELLIVLKFLKVFALMLLFAHLAACGWFFVGYNTIHTTSKSWVYVQFGTDDRSYIDDMDTFSKYSYSWYWAVVTLFTTGYGDIVATPGNKAEQWVVSICILVGTCFFAYFIGTLTSLITEGDRIKSVEVQKLEEAQAFCDHKKLPRELSRAVLTHIRYHCGYNYVFDETELIQSLPPYLQNDIHSYLAQTILMQIDFFNQFRKNVQILGQISLKMRSISCNESYCLFERGDRAKEIYIQRTGESIIDYHDGSTQRLVRGHVIGERSIISPKRKCTVKCHTFSEFYVLSVQDIVQILQTEYPTTWTKRWRKMVKTLKDEIKKNKKYLRCVDFNKYRKKDKSKKSQKEKPIIHNNNDENDENDEQIMHDDEQRILSQHEKHERDASHRTSAVTKGLHAWINQPSTIKTTRIRIGTDRIKSVQLNGILAVDTPTKSQQKNIDFKSFPVNDHDHDADDHKKNNHNLKAINENEKDKDKDMKDHDNDENNSPFKLNAFAKSEAHILKSSSDGKAKKVMNNNNKNNKKDADKFIDRSKSMQLPSLNQSVSHPTPKSPKNTVEQKNKTKQHKKARFGIFMRRNSLDRDDAIHRAARKRGASHATIHEQQTHPHTSQPHSIYDSQNEDLSSSRDSSDDSGDIVPHDYNDDADEETEDERSRTYTNHQYHNMIIDDSDIINTINNMDQVYKKHTKVKFMTQLGHDGKFTMKNKTITQMENPENIPAIAVNNNFKARKKTGMTGHGGRKGGKFGGKKRRANMGGAKKRTVNNNIRHNKNSSNKLNKLKKKSSKMKIHLPVKSRNSKEVNKFVDALNKSKKNSKLVSPVESNSSITYNNTRVDNLIMNDINLKMENKQNKHSTKHGDNSTSNNSNSASSTQTIQTPENNSNNSSFSTDTQIIYDESYANNMKHILKDKKNNTKQNKKQNNEVIDVDIDKGFVMQEAYNNEELNEMDDEHSDSTPL